MQSSYQSCIEKVPVTMFDAFIRIWKPRSVNFYARSNLERIKTIKSGFQFLPKSSENIPRYLKLPFRTHLLKKDDQTFSDVKGPSSEHLNVVSTSRLNINKSST